MVRIIPALLAKDKKDFVRRAMLVADIVDLAQIDVLDGKFLPEKSWAKPETIANFRLPLFFEAHLMIKRPENKISEWAKLADRIIFHFEATSEPAVCIQKIREYNKKVGLAINPGTSLNDVAHLLSKIDCLLVMAVQPGKMGQAFLPETTEKIIAIKKSFPKLDIEVDGGIKKEQLAILYRAGVRDLVVGSGIYDSEDPAATLKEYLKAVETLDKRSTIQN